MSASICWICGDRYVTDYCTRCGPPEAWGPTAEDYGAADKAPTRELMLASSPAARPSVREAHTQSHATAPPVCRHGVPYSEPCERCELGMLRDAVDDLVDADEYRRRWREP
jgi:hypothetical protein